MIIQPQMELSFDKNAAASRSLARCQRRRRAQWWFDQMRQVVDRALDRRPGLTPPPEQIHLSWSR